jgi:hypothetical protein
MIQDILFHAICAIYGQPKITRFKGLVIKPNLVKNRKTLKRHKVIKNRHQFVYLAKIRNEYVQFARKIINEQ